MFKTLVRATVAVAVMAIPLVASAAEAQNGRTTTVHQTANGNTVVKTVNHNPHGTVVKRTVIKGAVARPVARRWAKGQRFDRRYAPNYAVLDYRRYKTRRLYAPPRGYHWVRSGNDAVLVGVTTGLIAASIAGAIN